jgi:hypothetical protein
MKRRRQNKYDGLRKTNKENTASHNISEPLGQQRKHSFPNISDPT